MDTLAPVADSARERRKSTSRLSISGKCGKDVAVSSTPIAAD
jgi:hypothetical protein